MASQINLDNVTRILFLGDSIAYGGLYVDTIDAWLRARMPERQFEIINIGLPSENVSGLTEPGHADGQFPRPCLHERLGRALTETRPDLVFACYGMNDGIYYPFSEERFAAFRDGMERLVTEVGEAEVPLVLMTPPPFDALPILDRTLPDGGDSYPGGQPYRGYNEVLRRYSEWMVGRWGAHSGAGSPAPEPSAGPPGPVVLDLHTAMNAHLAARRAEMPRYTFSPDGVHPDACGHFLMAAPVLTALGAEDDADAIAAEAGEIADESGTLHLECRVRRPLPLDPQWPLLSVRQERVGERFCGVTLQVKGASAQSYQVRVNGVWTTTAGAEELAAGIALLPQTYVPLAPTDAELLATLRQRNRILLDAWLSHIGHSRPGMVQGMELHAARDKAAEIEPKLRELFAPISLQVELRPLEADEHSPFPGAVSDYRGFARHDFEVDGCTTWVVCPRQAAPGRPWIWRAEFFDHEPQVDVALLENGFHLVYITVGNTFGCPDAMAHWAVLHKLLTETYGLSPRPALEGLSRGGLYCYNWAVANPGKVGCIYGDAPVCDFKSWPAGKGAGAGSAGDWQKLIDDYHFASEEEALAYKGNPVDSLQPLAAAGIPLVHVYGDADESVPWEENTGVVAERYRELGGSITLMCKEGVQHHPHSLRDPRPVVEFVLRHAGG